jgi:hypothetical protein
MLSLACASPSGDDEAAPSVRTRSSAQPLTSLGPTLTFDLNRSTESSAPDELLVVGERVFRKPHAVPRANGLLQDLHAS